VTLDTPTLCRVLRIAPSTLNYWVKTGLVKPTAAPGRGQRFTRHWSVEDALLVRVVKALRDAGCPLPKVRQAKAAVSARWAEDLTQQVLYWDGGDIIALRPWGDVESLLRHPGQQLLHLVALPVGEWRDDLARRGTPRTRSDLRALRSRRSRSVRTSAVPLPPDAPRAASRATPQA
jgi:DNA-binding transcriptional MerR regulator